MNCLSFTKHAVINIGLFVLVGILTINATQGQEFVDTTSQNRNVVLEEFTGLNCQYCPDGHRIADNIKSNNPNSVFLVNIHTGGFARPSGNQPDLRTGLGSAIDNLMEVQGYPSAAINRTPFNGNKALSRDNWQNAANEILNQSSPVNIAIKTDYNHSTRELEIQVEGYYTSDSASESNRLNIAVLQNNIPGPQVDGGDFYPENRFSNGSYNHKHVLRDFITGQWGEVIENTNKGDLFKKTYTYKVPEEIKEIPVKPQFLQVTAYISEGKENIYTGTSEKLKFDDKYLVDLDITQNTPDSKPDDLCSDPVSPSIKITNTGNKTITKFDASIFTAGESKTHTFEGSLEPGSTKEITWYPIPGGFNDILFNPLSNIKSNGDPVYDKNIENDLIEDKSNYRFFEENVLKENFRAPFEGIVPHHVGLDQSKNPTLQLIYSEENTFGALESQGATTLVLNSRHGDADKPASIVFGGADLANINKPEVAFYYAYNEGVLSVDNVPEISLEASVDCGESWQTINQTTVQETGSLDGEEYYYPSSDEYKKVRWSLGELEDESNVMLRLRMSPNEGGNLLWVDEIKIGKQPWVASVEKNQRKNFEVSGFPNPANDHINLKIQDSEPSSVNIEIVNAQGKRVKSFQSDQSEIKINTASLSNGVYMAKLNIDGQMETVEFVVNH